MAVLKDVWVGGAAWRRIRARRTVDLQFAITKAATACVVGPFGGIGGGTIGEGEFVGPRELPGRRSREWRVTSGERRGAREKETRSNEAGSND